MIVAGVGCRRGCGAAVIAELVREATRQAAVQPDALAAPAFKRDEPGLVEAATALGLPLLFIDDAALHAVQGRCVTRSAAAARATGLASVAEAAALAASGGPLRLPRIATAWATCAIAGA